jgi:hypothetical protein
MQFPDHPAAVPFATLADRAHVKARRRQVALQSVVHASYDSPGNENGAAAQAHFDAEEQLCRISRVACRCAGTIIGYGTRTILPVVWPALISACAAAASASG